MLNFFSRRNILVTLSLVAIAWSYSAFGLVSYLDRKGTRHFVDKPSDIPLQFRNAPPKAQPVKKSPVVGAKSVHVEEKLTSFPSPSPVAAPDITLSPSIPAAKEENLVFPPDLTFTQRMAYLSLKRLEAGREAIVKLREKNLPGCEAVPKMSDCFVLLVHDHPPTLVSVLVTYLTEAVSVALKDKEAKLIDKENVSLSFAEGMLVIFEQTNPKKFEVPKIPYSGVTEAVERKILLDQEQSLLKDSHGKAAKNVEKLLADYEKKYLAVAGSKERDQFLDLKKRLEVLKNRDLTF